MISAYGFFLIITFFTALYNIFLSVPGRKNTPDRSGVSPFSF
jgi:hypothetical protein